MITSSGGEFALLFNCEGALRFTRFDRVRFGTAESVAPFAADLNGLRFEFSDGGVQRREQIGVRCLSDQFVIVIRNGYFDAVNALLVGKYNAGLCLPAPVVQYLAHFLELSLDLFGLLGSESDVTSRIRYLHSLLST